MIKVGQGNREYQAVKALNNGFQAVNFADVQNPADAAACVSCIRAETPETGGLRGVEQGLDVKHVLEVGTPVWIESTLQTVVCLMIEKQEAVETIEGILDIDGIDMVVFGRADYSMSIGLAGQRNHPKVIDAHRHIIEAAKKRGIIAIGEIDHPDDTEFYLDLGVRHFSLGIDIRILHNW